MRHTLRTALIPLVFVLMPPGAGQAGEFDATVTDVVENHILPRFDALAGTSEALDAAALADCTPGPALQEAWGAAFDAWISASHLRFGPTEADNRAFSLAFWPDSRGATPKALSALIADSDPAVESAEDFAQVSIAAQGFYALEYMLYDDQFAEMGTPAYRCALIRAMTGDIERTTLAIATDWHETWAGYLLPPPSGPYRDEEEVLGELFGALSQGLQFTSDTRLGRPMGTFDRPRATRAEARRSGRSLRHVELSLAALRDLAERLSGDDAELRAQVDEGFQTAQDLAADLDDPVFAGVDDPSGRLRVEILQQAVDHIRQQEAANVGARLGVSAGFNALDGD